MPTQDPPAPADSSQWYKTVVMPALLRAARTTYGSAIRAALADAGIDDMPRNGAFVVGAIARNGTPLSEIITYLGLSKQRSGQLVDALVDRGYLERALDPDDRRRMTVTLTDRGRLAANAGRKAVEDVDAALVARVGAETVMHARAALGALVELGEPGAG
jgi:DNA-binding MarR family transcriptional regulator